jgi:hypothetical protein
MGFYSQKIQRKVPGDWTFVIVTDRTDLDEQIADTFKAAGIVSQAEGDQCHASSGAQLAALLRGNHRYVFTLIQKFRVPELLCDRSDVVVITDEAHRSQYDTLALNMRTALPKALFTAFTGTPLIDGEERTREVFGDYVSIYDFQQAVEDGATVPLFYENRTPELQLVNPDLNDDIYAVIEAADLDGEEEQKLERELGRQYHIITRDDRLETIARDIVRHFLGRGFMGKAIAISIDKATTLRMYDKVQKVWQEETDRVRALVEQLPPDPTEEGEELRKRLHILTTTDMAVIVSAAQNEIADMAALGRPTSLSPDTARRRVKKRWCCMQRIRLDQHILELQGAEKGFEDRALVGFAVVKRGLGNRHTQLAGIQRDLGEKTRCAIGAIGLRGRAPKGFAITDKLIKIFVLDSDLGDHPLPEHPEELLKLHPLKQVEESGDVGSIGQLQIQRRA